ncbi:MFS transporter [Nocardia vaccinii]|uniref:MFS transporter n=1 Tax=Nocardia vaccinii TaxID=1822 RepID=UPI000A05185C|nr:MFS transporter [Nocardia vaccinii]
MTSTATSSASSAADTRWSARLWGMLITLCIVLFLDGLDVSMIGVALPSIGKDLHLGTSTLQWLVSGYVLGYGGLLLLGGRTADLLGRRRVFLIALGVFALASLAGGLVSSAALLIATRFIKGLAAAFTAPTGLSIITTNFAEGPARNRALSIYTVFGAGGYSMGLVFGGLMTGLGWRWTFLLPVPIALAALIAAAVLVPRDRRKGGSEGADAAGGHDLLGALLSTAAMLLLVYTVVSAPRAGWASARTVGSFATVAALFIGFVAVEKRVRHPLIRLGILRRATLVRASLVIGALAGSYFSWQFIVTLYLQDTLHWSPLQLAMALLPVGLLVALSSMFSDKLVDRFGTGPIIAVTMIAMSIGYLLFLRVNTHPSYLAVILPAVLLVGIGWIGFPSINIQATAGIDDEEQGLAAGVLQTSMQVGAAIVLAINTAIIASDAHTDGSPAAVLSGYRPGLIFVGVVAIIGALVALTHFLPAVSSASASLRRVRGPRSLTARPRVGHSFLAPATRPNDETSRERELALSGVSEPGELSAGLDS